MTGFTKPSQSAIIQRGCEVSTPYRAVSTMGNPFFVPGVFELYMYGILYFLGMGTFPPRFAGERRCFVGRELSPRAPRPPRRAMTGEDPPPSMKLWLGNRWIESHWSTNYDIISMVLEQSPCFWSPSRNSWNVVAAHDLGYRDCCMIDNVRQICIA